METSHDQGVTWNRHSLTSQSEMTRQNQRPHMAIHKDIAYIVWEKDDESFMSHIGYKAVNIKTGDEIFNQIISSDKSDAYSPKIVRIGEFNHIFWYDNESGSFQNSYSQYIDEQRFEFEKLRQVKTRTRFISATTYRGKPLLAWVNETGNRTQLFVQKNDEEVSKPLLIVKGLNAHNLTNKKEVTINWSEVKDISGIKEYRFLVTQNKSERINPERLGLSPYIRERKITGLEEGMHYVRVQAVDNAGNVSAVSEVSFEVDLTPPFPPMFVQNETNEEGGLLTNAPRIQWESDGEIFQGYEVVTRYFYGEFDQEAALREANLFIDNKNATKRAEFQHNAWYDFAPHDNGAIAIGVAGYDLAGNQSEFAFQTFLLNSYQPVTYIDSASFVLQGLVDRVLRIQGRGFKVDGEISRIVIDQDGEAPYDIELSPSQFRVASDRLVVQRTPIELEEGYYHIGVEHPERGFAWSKKRVSYVKEWFFVHEIKKFFDIERIRGFGKIYNASTIIFVVIGIIWLLVFMLIGRVLLKTIFEQRSLSYLLAQMDAQPESAITQEKKESIMKIKMSLALKYTLLILSLVIFIVTSTSAIVGVLALRNSTHNLTEEIKKTLRNNAH